MDLLELAAFNPATGSYEDTVNLMVPYSGVRQLTYTPLSPSFNGDDAEDAALAEGSGIKVPGPLDLAENFSVLVRRPSGTTIQDDVRTVQRLLNEAPVFPRRRQRRPIYLRWQLDGEPSVWRSLVKLGVFRQTAGLIGPQWKQRKLNPSLTLQRAWWWERADEVALPLTSAANGTPTISGVTITNDDDNWIQIAADAIEGDLPCPCRIEITNTTSGTPTTATIWLALNVNATPADFAHILEAETATGEANGVHASASGGAYKDCDWTGDTETSLLTWTLGTSLLDDALGAYISYLARFYADPTAGTLVRLQLEDSTGGVLWVSEQQALTADQVQELAAGRLAPALLGLSNIEPLTLRLYGQKTGGGSFDLDYIQLTPLDGPGLRVLTPRVGGTLAHNETLVDDGLLDVTYTRLSGGTKVSRYRVEGRPLMLRPGRLQRIYIRQIDSNGNGTITRTSTVKIYARPRRVTI